MKHFTCRVRNYATLLITFFFFEHSLNAQSYFAGTGSGSGNTSISATGVGISTLATANSGANNAAFGLKALNKNTIGQSNTGIGSLSLYSNTTGYYNTAVGHQSLYTNSNGIYNTAMGQSALYANIGGSNNTGLGFASLASNTIGNYNTSVGYMSLYTNGIGVNNTSIGANAMYKNFDGVENTAVGYSALYSNTNGDYNAAFGNLALYANTLGYGNVAFGHKALTKNIMGSGNIAIGLYSLLNNTDGDQNAAAGYQAMMNNTTGLSNSSFGTMTLMNNTTGRYNTAIGHIALWGNKAGSYNLSIGETSGTSSTFQTGCTYMGSRADATHDSLVNATAIGYQAKVDSSNKMVFGNTAVISIGGQVGWTTYSDQRLKTNINKSKLGLDFILSLNPVTYNYKAVGQKNILYTGLIAQEVDAAANKSGTVFSGVDKNGDFWGIRYAELTVPLISSMQELNERTNAREVLLQQRIEKLESELSALLSTRNVSGNAAQNAEAGTVLFQNQPNPFNESTVIRYQLKASDQNAAIDIRDLNGKLLKQIPLAQKGKGQVTINARDLHAGTYTYTLVVNNLSVETKLMILIK